MWHNGRHEADTRGYDLAKDPGENFGAGIDALAAKTTWANGTNVTVCGEGAVFELNANSPIDTKADVRLANGGKMALNGDMEVSAGVVRFED